jgi:hypothetical protein
LAHHTMSHDGGDHLQAQQDIDNWYAKQFYGLLDKLDSFSEGAGTVLDNTLVVWGRELGSTAHRHERFPLVMAGGKNLGLRQGVFLNLDEKTPHVKLLVSIAQLMGLETDTFGNRTMNSGPLAGLTA